jgi:hypothetical protein
MMISIHPPRPPDQEHVNPVSLSRTIFAHPYDDLDFYGVDSGFRVVWGIYRCFEQILQGCELA